MKRLMMLALLALPLFARDARVDIVSADDAKVTYRELQPLRFIVDGVLYHRKDCPAAPRDGESIAAAVATLRRLQPHSCAVGAKAEYAQFTVQRAPRDLKVISVLFLGNSLVYYNEIPKITQAIAAREKRPLRVDAVARSGVTLEQLWTDTDARKRLWLAHWDYVILQGGAGAAHPAYNADAFQRYLDLFANDVRKSGATPLYYMVWRHENPANFESASLAAAKKANVRVIPVLLAWRDLIRRGRFEKLDVGGGHPDAFGAYLVACSVYSTIYDKPAHGTPYDLRHLAAPNETYDDALRTQRIDPDDARALQDAAWAAVRSLSSRE